MRTQTQSPTRLHGHALTYARVTWGFIFLFYLGSFLAALPDTLSQQKGFAQQSQGWTEDELRTSLAQLGISFEAYQKYDTLSNVGITLVFLGLGLFIFWRKSDDWMALLFSLFFIMFSGTATFGTLAQHHPTWKIVQALTESLASVAIVVLFIFPDGNFVPRWTRWVVLSFVGVQIWRLFQPGLYNQLAFVFVLPLFVCLLLSQIYRYLRVSTPTQRQQTKWVVYGFAVGFTPLLVYLLFFLSNPDYDKPGALGMGVFLIGNLLWTFSLVSLVLSVTFAILRSHLWDIDIIVRKTLIYSLLTTVLALVFFGFVVVLQPLLSSVTDAENSPLAIVLSTLAIAALFNPLRARLQAFIDRRFYRQKYNADQTLAEFARSALNETDLDALSVKLKQVVSAALQPEYLSLSMKLSDTNSKSEEPG